MRMGIGYDVHPLVRNRTLILGGVRIPHLLGLVGHSDADVLTHAVMDALLGAVGRPDIGHYFPSSDPRFRDADSLQLLAQVRSMLQDDQMAVHNVDATLAADEPVLAPYVPRMKDRLAEALRIPSTRVGVKATRWEGMLAEGKKVIACWAVATVVGRQHTV